MNFALVLVRAADALNDRVGRAVSWLALFLVLLQFVIVGMRYVFGVSSIFVQEGIVYLHAAIFLAAAGYTLLHDGHVRVDIFYRPAGPRGKAWVDLVGVVAFLLPFAGGIFAVSWPYVMRSWHVLETSQEGSGIPAVFLLKTLILVYAALVIVQGLAMATRAVLFLAGSAAVTSYGEESGGVQA
jgi:TRAP-type mannitol/chloroaromatic compound transport system permease small subunit